MPRPHPLRSLLILSLAALAFALAQTMLIPALTELAKSLDTDASGVAWTVTAYLLAAAVCTPVFGRLGDMFGKRRLLVIALGIFGAGSVVSALGTSLEVVVAGPRPAGRRRRHLPALLRDHPRRVPAREGRLQHRPDLRHVRHRRRRRPDPRRPDHRPRLLPLDLLARRDQRRGRGDHDRALRPRVARPHARPRRRARRDRARARPERAAARDRPGQRVGLGRHRARSACSRPAP